MKLTKLITNSAFATIILNGCTKESPIQQNNKNATVVVSNSSKQPADTASNESLKKKVVRIKYPKKKK